MIDLNMSSMIDRGYKRMCTHLSAYHCTAIFSKRHITWNEKIVVHSTLLNWGCCLNKSTTADMPAWCAFREYFRAEYNCHRCMHIRVRISLKKCRGIPKVVKFLRTYHSHSLTMTCQTILLSSRLSSCGLLASAPLPICTSQPIRKDAILPSARTAEPGNT